MREVRPGGLDVSILAEGGEIDHCLEKVARPDYARDEAGESFEERKKSGVRFSETTGEGEADTNVGTIKRGDVKNQPQPPSRNGDTIQSQSYGRNGATTKPQSPGRNGAAIRPLSPIQPQFSVKNTTTIPPQENLQPRTLPHITTHHTSALSPVIESPRTSPSRSSSPKHHSSRHSPYPARKSPKSPSSTLDFFKNNIPASPSCSSPELSQSSSPVYQTPMDDGHYARFKAEPEQKPTTDTDPRIRACSPTWHLSQKMSGKVHETFERNVSVESLVGEGYQYEPTIEGIYSDVPSRASSFSIGGNSGMGSMTQLFCDMGTGLNEGRLDGIRGEIDVLES
jgi:hypothetical protein